MVPSPLDLFCSEVGDRFLVMNRIWAKTLYEWRHEDPIEIEDQIRVVKWIAESVCALHGEGVVWSDLSPSNILIDDDEGCVYLIDFEHAQISPSPSEDMLSCDLKALGRLILWLANPLDSLFKSPYPYPYRPEADELANRYPSYPDGYIDACSMALEGGVGLEEILSILREFA
jgi:tRNA A-37 threonylcarbamoyl transferase component Bud32